MFVVVVDVGCWMVVLEQLKKLANFDWLFFFCLPKKFGKAHTQAREKETNVHNRLLLFVLIKKKQKEDECVKKMVGVKKEEKEAKAMVCVRNGVCSCCL